MKSKITYWLVLAGCLFPVVAVAQPKEMTIEEVLRHVYDDSPLIESSRYGLKASHELYPQAIAGWHPRIDAEAMVTHSRIETDPFSTGDGATTKSASISAEQPIFRGGRTLNETEAANSRIKAGYKRMLQTEQDVFLYAVEAYMNVIRDRMLSGFQQASYDALLEEDRSLKARFEAGDVTKTDVKRAEARVAAAAAQKAGADGDLKTSEAVFEQIIGFVPPPVLKMPTPHFQLPSSASALLETARKNNPELFAAKFDHLAAQYEIGVAQSDRYPQVSAFASHIKEYDPQPGILDESEASTFGLRMRVNLYEGGANMSRVREAKNRASQRMTQIIEAERQVKSQLADSWGRLQSYRSEIESRQIAVASADLSRQGVREEARLGERTSVETLDAERDLLEAQTALVRVQRDRIVAEYELAASLGLLLPEHMGMADIAYDPGPHYRVVADRIFSDKEGDPAKRP